MKNAKFCTIKTLIGGSLLLLSSNALSFEAGHGGEGTYDCFHNISPTTPNNLYTVSADGASVLDNRTGLTWSRCSLGQVWDQDTQACLGTATPLTWLDAMNNAESYAAGGLTNWRLPNVKELATVVEYSCNFPAMNLEIFPNTEVSSFWSATPNRYSTQTGSISESVLVLRITTGEILTSKKDSELSARYVHD